MSTAKLNVWITERGSPCRIESRNVLFVYVLHCNGEVLEWCDRRYVGIPAKCGHVEIEIPVGCYVVGAVESPSRESTTSLGNHLTHIAVVRATCGSDVCVTLFNPHYHHCGHWFLEATRRHLAQQQGLPGDLRDVARRVEPQLAALVTAIPEDAFTINQARALAETPATKPPKKNK